MTWISGAVSSSSTAVSAFAVLLLLVVGLSFRFLGATSGPPSFSGLPSSPSQIVLGLPLFLTLGMDGGFLEEGCCDNASGAGVRLVDR